MKPGSLIIIAIVAAAAAGVVVLRQARHPGEAAPAADQPPPTPSGSAGLPRLLDLGAGSCVPCRMMSPILEDLRTTCAGSLRVEFIDVREDRSAAQAHRISVIPTQIFFAADGSELFRHQGFMAREDILAQWRRLGYDLLPTAPAAATPATDAGCPTGAACPGAMPAQATGNPEAAPSRRGGCEAAP